MAASTQAVPQFAKHPLTGAPIRIMTTEASVWRDQKTLVWLDAAAATEAAAKRWNRFEVGVTSKDALDAALAAGLRVEVAVALGEPAAWAAWMAAGGWESVALLAVPKSLVEHIGLVELRAMKIKNMICIDEMHELYPFVGGAWAGTEDDAKVLLALALHMGRTAPVADLAAAALTRPLRGLTLLAERPVPAPLWLVQQYYKPSVAKRRKEIDACLKANVENTLIDRIVLLNEEACLPAPFKSGAAAAAKIEERVLGKRLTYADVFRWIAAEAPANAIVAFANSDVFLDTSSTRLLWSADLTNKFLALLRWDVEGTDAAAQAAAKLFGPRPDSQDCWVVAADSVRAAFKDEASFAGMDFPFGQGGCDNAITLELLRRKFVVANPALTLRTYHYHTSAVRNYDPRNIVSKPAYLYVQPTGFHDMRPDLAAVPSGATQISWRRRSFARPVAGPSSAAQLRTFCTMVGRATNGAVTLDVEGANLWPSATATGSGGPALFRATEVFQTREGLTFGYDSIHVGRTKAAQEAWGASELSSMAAALSVEAAAAVPLPDAVARDPARYVLEYLAKVFVLLALARQGLAGQAAPLEFFCANEPKCIETVKMFAWPQGQVPVVSRDETQQAWCGEAFVWPYSDEPAGFPSQEEVAALRGALGLGGWLPAGGGADEKRLVVVVDGAVVTDATVEALESLTDVDVIWPGRTDLQHGLGLLRGAAGLVVAAGSPYASWAWALPLGAAVWELQSEMRPSAALLHLCGAADLHHRLLITPKGAMGDAERAAATAKLVADVRLMLGLLGPVPELSSKPLLLMPAGHKGFFDHAGDSFRETARLWAQRGFVELTESPLVTQVWLGAAGKTLLYDRPTLEWLRAAPAEEQTYQLALFGNPAPPQASGSKGQANAKAWIFWPRKPNLVESLVAVGLPATPFEARPDGLVFYGRSENAVQLGNRKKEDWSKACGKFVHVEGTGAYPFTHEEYLVNLSKARFGLCLAGYGRKCHREVECMAMGCVPIVAPEVDMTSYAEPPQPGVHFFRVGGPEEAAALVASVTPLRWAAMSAACRAWWRRNASVEGAWEVTRRLIPA